MPVLILGLILWWGAHLWKRVAPASRARFGHAGKGIVSVVLILSILLMIFGFRSAGSAGGPVWWGPTPASKGANNLLVLIGFYLVAASVIKPRFGLRMHHPQLSGVSLWALGHLIVWGELRAILLFGGILLWALVEMAVINRAEPGWTPSIEPVNRGREWGTVLAAVVAYGIVGLIHGWIGPSPWGA